MLRTKAVLALALLSCSAEAQIVGCPDPGATNFTQSARFNDGSCAYPEVTIRPDTIGVLPLSLDEISGLVEFNGSLWSHQDGGGPNHVFEMNPENGEVRREVAIDNATNRDWEDIAISETHMFIGDFGNNAGNRDDLVIYRIDLDDLRGREALIPSERIDFTYEDQDNFDGRRFDHDFDCEAMIFLEDRIYLFSKSWRSFDTKVYELPSVPGRYVARETSRFNMDGVVVTGADVDEEFNAAVLTGYTKGVSLAPFIMLLYDYEGIDFFSGNKRTIKIDMAPGVLEAVSMRDDGGLYLALEHWSNEWGHLMDVPPSVWTHPNLLTDKEGDLPRSERVLAAYPNPANDAVTIETEGGAGTIRLVDIMGRVVLLERYVHGSSRQLDLDGVPSGVYFLELTNKDERRTRTLLVQR